MFSALSEPCNLEGREERSRYPVSHARPRISSSSIFCLFLVSFSLAPRSREGHEEEEEEEDEKWREEGTTCPLAFS